ncbi:MAG: hypothetical protein AAFN92_19300, partial [Bacteroidota bacterium]
MSPETVRAFPLGDGTAILNYNVTEDVTQIYFFDGVSTRLLSVPRVQTARHLGTISAGHLFEVTFRGVVNVKQLYLLSVEDLSFRQFAPDNFFRDLKLVHTENGPLVYGTVFNEGVKFLRLNTANTAFEVFFTPTPAIFEVEARSLAGRLWIASFSGLLVFDGTAAAPELVSS